MVLTDTMMEAVWLAALKKAKGANMDKVLDFVAIFKRLAAEGERQHHAVIGGIDVRLVRVEAGVAGRWDRHDETPETVIVWAGAFDVAYRDRIVCLRTMLRGSSGRRTSGDVIHGRPGNSLPVGACRLR
jgi:hypothetical protein